MWEQILSLSVDYGPYTSTNILYCLSTCTRWKGRQNVVEKEVRLWGKGILYFQKGIKVSLVPKTPCISDKTQSPLKWNYLEFLFPETRFHGAKDTMQASKGGSIQLWDLQATVTIIAGYKGTVVALMSYFGGNKSSLIELKTFSTRRNICLMWET